MCGICGRLSKSEPRPIVEAMNALLRHRGPDATGSFFDAGIGLAMSRLAIIDVDGGQQPVFNEDESVVALHNGEIYNFRELRAELRAQGHVFKSGSDTEVLVHGYETWGTGLFGRLKGMFASCIWDRRARRLIIGRDRFGEKPLYYREGTDGSFSFSSELRSLMADTDISRRPDRTGLGYYLRVGFVPEPRTAFEEVRALPAGCYLEWANGEVRVEAYFRPHYCVDPSLADDHYAEEACLEVVRRAVAKQLVSDVPVGAFLSGGIDSSTVVAAMQHASPRPVQTYTVRFQDQDFDESAIARKTAERLGTDHHEIVLPDAAFHTDDLWRIVDHVGQPFHDSSAIPTYVLCRTVRQHVKVALTGDGGDEMFAGYPFFWWGLAIKLANRAPDAFLSLAATATRRLARQPQLQHKTILRRIRRALEASTGHAEGVPARVLSIFDGTDLECLIEDDEIRRAGAGPLEELTEMPAQARGWSSLRKLMYYRLRNNLPGDMLTKIDRMSMACSLELRAPLLDPEVASFAASLPDEQLLKGRTGKQILRRTMRSHLPAEVFTAPKSGFSIPLHKFWNDDFYGLTDRLLGRGGPMEGIADMAELRRLREAASTTGKDTAQQSVFRASHQLWSLVMLAAWSERYGVTW